MTQDPIDLAQKLFELQKREHDGAGVPEVKEIIEALRVSNITQARTITDWQWHKVKDYKNIRELLESELF